MSTSKYHDVKSEADFPGELPAYGIWWVDSSQFTVHKTLMAAKNLATARGTNNAIVNNRWGYRTGPPGPVIFTGSFKVYERNGSKWILLYEMTKGDERGDHDLWKAAAPSTPQTVSDDDIAAAIASITGNQD